MPTVEDYKFLPFVTFTFFIENILILMHTVEYVVVGRYSLCCDGTRNPVVHILRHVAGGTVPQTRSQTTPTDKRRKTVCAPTRKIDMQWIVWSSPILESCFCASTGGSSRSPGHLEETGTASTGTSKAQGFTLCQLKSANSTHSEGSARTTGGIHQWTSPRTFCHLRYLKTVTVDCVCANAIT